MVTVFLSDTCANKSCKMLLVSAFYIFFLPSILFIRP